ncbi:MAG: hypothetical protein QOG87_2753, partial [Actinomycetota bacterium]
MRVGIGAQLLSYPRASRSGVGNYIRLLLAHLPTALGEHYLDVFAGSDAELPTAKIDTAHVSEHRFALPLRARAVRLPYEQAWLPAAARRRHVDVFHHPDPLALRIGAAPRTVVTVHDMTPFLFPETFGMQRARYKQLVVRRAVAAADRVITDSEATRRDVLELLDIETERVVTVHLGTDAGWQPASSDRLAEVHRRLGVESDYLLSVGTMEPRKNLARLIEAYGIAHRRGLDVPLVVVGPTGWKSQTALVDPARHGVEDKVVLAGFVTGDELRALYARASAFVYPSLYEGFGLPVLEAMACGVPVIASSAPAV